MTRNEKIVKLLYFKGVINNKHINIKLCDEKKNSGFAIVISNIKHPMLIAKIET